MNFLLVFIGGGIGCLLRYLIGLQIQKTSTSLPWATFIANVSACFVFALVVWFTSNKGTNQTPLKLLLLTGFCGGLSTFSSFGYETFLLLKQGLLWYALLNILFSTSCCILIFFSFNTK
jgi:CrcB protein